MVLHLAIKKILLNESKTLEKALSFNAFHRTPSQRGMKVQKPCQGLSEWIKC